MPLKLKRRKGRPHWYITGTVRGVLVRETTGTDNRAAAEAIVAQREWQIIQSSIFGRASTATFAQAAVSFIENGGDARFLKRPGEKLGDVPLGRIDQQLVDQVVRELYPDAAPATRVRQGYAPIIAVLHHGAKKGWCDRKLIERPKLPLGRVRWITFAEAERLIANCAPHLHPLIVFLLGTGARVSEALYLDWQHVDLVRGHVAFVDTKNGSSRGVPLHGRVVAELRKLRHRKGMVFRTDDGSPYAIKTAPGGGQIKTAFMGACRRANIKNFRPHDCRHTWASWHYAANRDLAALMALGGWKSERMVLRYAHLNTAHLAPSIAASLAAWSAPVPIAKAKRKARA
jgi:integrase